MKMMLVTRDLWEVIDPAERCYGASSGVTPECSGNEAELGEQEGTRQS